MKTQKGRRPKQQKTVEPGFWQRWQTHRKIQLERETRKRQCLDFLNAQVRRSSEQTFTQTTPPRPFEGDPFTRETIPSHRRIEAIALVEYTCQLAVAETMPTWELLKSRLDIDDRRLQNGVQDILEMDRELRPQIQPAVIVDPPAQAPNQPPKHRVVVKQVTNDLRAHDLSKKLWLTRLTETLALLGVVISQVVDTILVWIIMNAWFEGTTGYSAMMAPFLTVAVVATIVFLAHRAVTGRSVLAWLIFFIVSGVLGYLRLKVAEPNEEFDAGNLAMAVLTVLPIPVMAYLAARALCLVKSSNLTAKKLAAQVDPLRLPYAVSRKTTDVIDRFNQEEINHKRRLEEALNFTRREEEEARRRGLQTLRTRALQEITQLRNDREAFVARISQIVVAKLRPEIVLYANILFRWSEERSRSNGKKDRDSGDGRAIRPTAIVPFGADGGLPGANLTADSPNH